jgi:hypothetical protein
MASPKASIRAGASASHKIAKADLALLERLRVEPASEETRILSLHCTGAVGAISSRLATLPAPGL